MLNAVDLIDIIRPRGGQSLTERVMTESKVPTLAHLIGNCHIYIHRDANVEMARQVTTNAKLRRPGICGAAESLLVDRCIGRKILPLLLDDLVDGGCTIRGDMESQAIDKRIDLATEEDWSKEYLDKIISVKLVGNIEEAVIHINQYGSEAIPKRLSPKMTRPRNNFSVALIAALFCTTPQRNSPTEVNLAWELKLESLPENFMHVDQSARNS